MTHNKVATVATVIGLLANFGVAQPAAISYHLQYAHADDSSVRVAIEFSTPLSAPRVLVIPRNYPGGYSLVPYDSFVETPRCFSSDGQALETRKASQGPRWNLGRSGESISRIEYQVNLARMEQELPYAVDSSRIRPHYAGLLGYSVFGYIDRLEDRPIELRVDAPPQWHVLTTLAPAAAPRGTVTARADNYYALADSQVLMGPDLKILHLPGKIALVMAVYAEGEEDISLEGRLAREALDRVQSYFGTTPFQQYTVQLELLRPQPGHDYGFSQEHLNSGTFSLSIGSALTESSSAAARAGVLFNYAHHMAHCWIPKRAYGVGYMPFTWEMPPVIDTIWFNEGFARYAAIEALAEAMPARDGVNFRERELAQLREVLARAPAFIKEMPLLVLSREASFIYSRDFRIGMSTFARGALMAAEIDDRIRDQSRGRKSLRDALRYLLQRGQSSPGPFKTEELARIFREGTGVDVQDIFDRWMSGNPDVNQYRSR